MTAQGSARTRFRRAVASGDPMLVLDAARDVGNVSLGEALLICLVLAHAGDDRAPRAQARWHARWVVEHDCPLSRSRALLAAVAALPELDALERVLRSAGDTELLGEVERWRAD